MSSYLCLWTIDPFESSGLNDIMCVCVCVCVCVRACVRACVLNSFI